MILNSAPQDQAVLSNVGQIGEFRIRNSAKAFSILSSGLYANKVRAIIRELSCNAVDSHTAAGKTDTPFDVHLPNSLEPWFSIRDYGTGLSADQVTNIYTTYFESTKTASNEFIGALGLGSKSPFSYTDNFTVTAVQNGVKGVYTAFINESGVPSIAQMMTENTTDPNGVEVKFSVNDRHDFDKFRQEARNVYTYFKLKPVVSGAADFEFKTVQYETENIIPGVHSMSDSNGRSYALMGNIAYPISIPDSEKTLGKLRDLLNCGLLIEFKIGELDFQASREGLSYIDLTINSIKNKLEQLNEALAKVLAVEADAIKNEWERAYFLETKLRTYLWTNAVNKYIIDTKFDLLDNKRYNRLKEFELREDVLRTKYNMLIRGFHKSQSYQACSNNKAQGKYNYDIKDKDGNPERYTAWTLSVSKDARFIINDTSIGVTERAKYHFRNSKDVKSSVTVYVLEPFDKTRPILTKPFFKLLSNPPEAQILKATSLLEKPRADGSMGKNVTILTLVEKSYGRWGGSDANRIVWNDAGKADSFDTTKTHYYIPLSGFQSLGKVGNVKLLKQQLEKSGIFTGKIYGVRKTDMEFIKTQKNWVNIDTMIVEKLALLDNANVMGMVKQAIDFKTLFKYNATSNVTNPSSPYVTLYNTFKDVESVDKGKQQSLEFLCRAYAVQSTVSPATLINKYTQEVEAFKQRYPMLKHAVGYDVKIAELGEYINLIDQTKGV